MPCRRAELGIARKSRLNSGSDTYNGRMEHVQTEEARKPWLMGAGLAVALIAAAKLALHLYAGRHYGYFVDELYYLACARHLDWGYVDQPPLIAAIAGI